jgi:hypothetical protein
MGNIKSFLVEFIMAFLLGIAGWLAMFYIAWLCTGSGANSAYIAEVIGIPLGSSLGISIIKTGFKSGTYNVLCLFTSLAFGFLVAHLFAAIGFILLLPLVPLFAVIGYNVMAVLLRGRKESPR